MRKYAAVIINYNNFLVTINCVESLLKWNDPNLYILIVDNGSINESYEVLNKKFSKKEKVFILKSKKNYGYAGGCNIGIDFAKNKLDVLFVALLNSDLLFTKSNAIKDAYNFYEKNLDCSVVNITLYNRDLSFQIPYGRFSKHSILEMFKNYGYIFKNFIINFFKIKRCAAKRNLNLENKFCIINGPAYCLTPTFFSKYNYLYEKSFLYLEEFNLYLLLKKSKMNSKTVKNDIVIHLEGASSTECKDISNKKLCYMLKSSFRSVNLLIKSKRKISKMVLNTKVEYYVNKEM